MSVYNYKKRELFSGTHLLGLLLLLGGILASVSPFLFPIGIPAQRAHYIGLITFLIGLGLASFHEGIVFDFLSKRYKEYYTLVGLKFGKWYPLPELTNLGVMARTRRVSNTPNGISPTLSGDIEEFYVLLTDNHETPQFKLKFTKQRGAQVCAARISKELNLKIHNYD